MATLLIIFAKEPVPGQVKTRLCPPLTPERAALLYQAFLRDTLEAAAALAGMHLALAYDPPAARDWFHSRVPAGVRLFPQEGADLGERMALAFDRGFRDGFNPVLLRGSDTPDLPGTVVQDAAAALAGGRAQVALGPSLDGGYYLVGLTAPQPELFRGLAWSGPTVCADTLARAGALALPVHLLPAWRDLDRPADLAAFLRQPHPLPQPGWRSHRLARQYLGP